jgi:hypothetical protein
MGKLVETNGVLAVPKLGNAVPSKEPFREKGMNGNEELSFELKPSTVN